MFCILRSVYVLCLMFCFVFCVAFMFLDLRLRLVFVLCLFYVRLHQLFAAMSKNVWPDALPTSNESEDMSAWRFICHVND